MVKTEEARVSIAEPSTKKAALTCMGTHRPYVEVKGPAARAPARPPTMNMEEMVAKDDGLMGMQSTGSADLESVTYDITFASVEAGLTWQVMTSSGALSSAWLRRVLVRIMG